MDAQHPQNMADYQIAKAAAACAHQQSMQEAQSTFRDHHADIKAKHAANYERAKANFEQYKSDAGSPHLAAVTREWIAAKSQVADHRPAMQEMDRAVRAIDAIYHARMKELAIKHGIGAPAPYWRAS